LPKKFSGLNFSGILGCSRMSSPTMQPSAAAKRRLTGEGPYDSFRRGWGEKKIQGTRRNLRSWKKDKKERDPKINQSILGRDI